MANNKIKKGHKKKKQFKGINKPLFYHNMPKAAQHAMDKIEKWSKDNSPIAYMMYEILWYADDDHSKIVKILSKHWKSVCEQIRSQTKVNLNEYIIVVPDDIISLDINLTATYTASFRHLINSLSTHFSKIGRLEEVIPYLKDIADLFIWDKDVESTLHGMIGNAMWRIGDKDGAEEYFKNKLFERDEIIMEHYSYCLLSDKRWDDAEKVLKGYENTENEVLKTRFKWLESRGLKPAVEL